MTDNSVQRRTLSVAMIVRDEEQYVAETIRSVRSVADEIVVVDTGSVDRTVEIARQSGAKVLQRPWQDSFSDARNYALGQVTGDWVLWLNGGERLPGDSVDALRSFVDREADPSKVYMILVQVPQQNANDSAEQAMQARLMPRDSKLQYTGRVRETLRPAIIAAGMDVAAGAGRIIASGRNHDPARKAARARRNLRLVTLETSEHKGSPEVEEAAKQDGTLARLLIVAAEALNDLGRHENANTAYRQAVSASEHGSTEMLEAYYGVLTSFAPDGSQSSDQLSAALEALEAFPFDAQLLCAVGNYLQQRRQYDLAARSFETAVQHGRVDLETWHLAEVAEVASVCLSLTQQLLGKDDDARKTLDHALECSPTSMRIRKAMLDLHIKLGEEDDAVALFASLPVDAKKRDAFVLGIRGACRAAKKEWVEALGFLQMSYLQGCRDTICLKWLVVTLLSNGHVAGVADILRQWLALEPGNAEALAYLKAVTDHQAKGNAGQSGESADQSGASPSVDASEAQQEPVDRPSSSLKKKSFRIDPADAPAGSGHAAKPAVPHPQMPSTADSAAWPPSADGVEA